MTRDISTTSTEYVKELVAEKVIEAIDDLQERYDCFIYLDKDDVELLGDAKFYEQLLKNINKHKWEV